MIDDILSIPTDEFLSFFLPRQMLDALMYVHSLSIVHRDIKPENWLFSRIDTVDGLKLIDFGLAKRTVNDEKLKGPCGTLHYVAPETLSIRHQ